MSKSDLEKMVIFYHLDNESKAVLNYIFWKAQIKNPKSLIRLNFFLLKEWLEDYALKNNYPKLSINIKKIEESLDVLCTKEIIKWNNFGKKEIKVDFESFDFSDRNRTREARKIARNLILVNLDYFYFYEELDKVNFLIELAFKPEITCQEFIYWLKM